MTLENKLSFLKSLEFGMELKKHNGKMGMVKIIQPHAAIFIELEDINGAETREDLRILYTRALRKTLLFLEKVAIELGNTRYYARDFIVQARVVQKDRSGKLLGQSITNDDIINHLEVMGFGECHALKNTPLGFFIWDWKEAKENSSLRDGQLLMNMLAEKRPRLYKELTGTDIDPFHNDDLIQKALDHLKKVW